MFDILLYLFENYFHSNFYPDQDALARKLAAAGFDSDEISRALDWLSDLENLSPSQYPESLAQSRSLRCYSDAELKRLNAESRGFLTFLEGAGILNPVQREWVIDRVLALTGEDVTVEKVKWIALIVLWRQGHNQDYLLLEELLFSDNEQQLH